MNLLELVQAQLTDDRIDRLAAVVAESGSATRKALGGTALPAVLAGLSGEFAGEAGAARLLELMRAGGHDGSLLTNLDGALSGGAHTEALLNLGKGQVGAILGDRIDSVAELMVAETGIRRSSAGALLGLLVPLVLATLGRQLSQGGGAARLATLLAGARPAIAPLASPGLAPALGVADLAAPVAAAAGVTPARSGSVWPWLIVPACALAMFFALRSCQQGAAQATPAVTGAEPAAAAEDLVPKRAVPAPTADAATASPEPTPPAADAAPTAPAAPASETPVSPQTATPAP